MAVKPLVQLVNLDDPAVRARLGKSALEVNDFGLETQTIIDDLLDTLAHHRIAVGLAAPQIGVDARIAVVDLKADPPAPPLIVVNPVVLETSGKKDVKKESCMSVPHFRGPVERRHKLKLQFQDRSGTSRQLLAEGFLARAVAHEVDHLNGLLYLDRMADPAGLEPVTFFR